MDLELILLLAQSCTFQICPSLEHASLVLLNSLLDTVPGEYCPGEGRAGHQAAGQPTGSGTTAPLPWQ